MFCGRKTLLSDISAASKLYCPELVRNEIEIKHWKFWHPILMWCKKSNMLSDRLSEDVFFFKLCRVKRKKKNK